jgi:hypothetical protein
MSTRRSDVRLLLQKAIEHLDRDADVTAREDISEALRLLTAARPPDLGRTRVITLLLHGDVVTALQVLNPHSDVRHALLELAVKAADGVYRPGAWERGWLEQAFGSDWQNRLEPDPNVPTRMQVKR